MPHALLLTGTPGVGKTTVVERVAAALSDRTLGGFLTREIREGGQRVGFAIEGFEGHRAILAHTRIRSPYRVGRYGVDVEALDRAVAVTLAPAPGVGVHLVDEIGKMECFSADFVAAVRRLLDAEGPIVATVARKGGGFIAEVKARGDVALWEVTRHNRDDLPGRVLAFVGALAG